MTRTAQRFYIETWGCQMNELDSRRMAGQLVRQGMIEAADPAAAEVILLNSCSVREKAEHKSYSRLGEYRSLKLERPDLRIGFCGCVAQQVGERALERVPELDFVVGTGRVGELAGILDHVRRTGERLVATGFPADRQYDLDAISRDGSHKGMVTVIEGCDKRCTFCIVPTTRGPERSRPLADIVREVEDLVGRGFVEIELLGQTVNHWREPRDDRGGDAALDFADLLDAVAGVPGVRRLRFVTSYPRDFTPRMVERFRMHANLCDYLHLPVQSGSDRVLRRMGRGYQVSSYRELLAQLREARPALAISTDFIVGFPGEDEDDFEQTLDLVRRSRFSTVFAFKYSPRPGTAALRLPQAPVPDDVADRRLQRLFDLQAAIQRELNEGLVGRELEVLVTGASRQPGYLASRTSCHRAVHFAVPGGTEAPPVGSLLRVRVTRSNPYSLLAERVHAGPAAAAMLPAAAP
jgi:tRNA-2-methylthio-N6-dimethylallyladenosine synthase